MTAAPRDPYRPYRQVLLTPARVKQLSQLRPGRVVRDVVFAWTVIIAAWTATAIYTQWWTLLVAAVVVGTRYYALFIVGHDGLHRRLFSDRVTNDLFCDVLVLGPIGAIRYLLRYALALPLEECRVQVSRP